MNIKTVGYGVLGLGILLACMVSVMIVFGPLSQLVDRWGNTTRPASIQANLQAARARWEAQAISDYTIDVQGGLINSCIVDATLTVKRGKIQDVEERSPLGGCTYSDLLMPEMYRRIEQNLAHSNWSELRLRVSFDAEYGYVRTYRYEFRCYLCSESVVGALKYSNFKPTIDP